MADKIILTGIEVQGRHGCSEEERRTPQTFIVDVELSLDLSAAGKSDDLGDTIDYAVVISDIKKIVGGTSRNLIETVAKEIVDFMIKRYMLLESVKVVLRKSAPPSIKDKFAWAGVEITGNRATESLAGIWRQGRQWKQRQA